MRIDEVAYDHPDAARLVEEVQQEYVTRYGGGDATPVEPSEFAAPRGLFLVGYLEGVPVACGGWRGRGGDAELKRVYVTPARRRGGLARLLLAELERRARAAGLHRMILETGDRQPEAVALYERAGYIPIPAFGHYADDPLSVHLGKELPAI